MSENFFLSINDNEALFNNGVYALCFHLELIEKFSLGKEDYISLNNHFYKHLRSLPEGSIFFKQDFFNVYKNDCPNLRETNFLEKYTKKHFKGKNVVSHNSFLFFLLPKKLDFKNISNPFKKVDKNSIYDYDLKIDSFKDQIIDVVNSLSNIILSGGNSISIEKFTEEQILNYPSLFFNLFDETFTSDRFFHKDYFTCGDKYGSMVCLLDEKQIPGTLNYPLKDDKHSDDKSIFFKNYGDFFSFDLDCSHVYNQICFIEDSKIHINNLRKANDNLHKSSSIDLSNKKSAELSDKLLDKVMDNSNNIKLIRGHNNIIIISNNFEDVKNNTNKCKELFRKIDISPYIPKGNFLNALFHYSFPFYSQHLTEKQMYITDLAVFCSFINNTTNYKSDDNGMYFNSRIYNKPIIVDTLDSEKKYMNASNFAIFSGTGGGKSVLANHIISNYKSAGCKSVIIDLGGSYKKLYYLFKEDITYISFEEGKELQINPFYIDKDLDIIDNNLSSFKIDELIEFISVHYNKDNSLQASEKTSLRKIIVHYYKSKFDDNYSLPNFIEFVRDNDIHSILNIEESFFNKSEFLHLMSEFLDGGSYDYLYKSRENNIFQNLKEKKIIVFELDKVKSNTFLLTIMLQIINTIINKVIWSDKKTKGIILFDEVAEQLKWNGVLQRIEFYYQAIRKQNGSVGMILQSINQLPNNTSSKSIIENMQQIFVLGAKNYKDIQDRFNLSDHSYYMMSSIKSDFNSKRPYSEFFHLRGKNSRILRLELSQEVYWAYQTEGKENERLLELYNSTGNMEQTINKFIKSN